MGCSFGKRNPKGHKYDALPVEEPARGRRGSEELLVQKTRSKPEALTAALIEDPSPRQAASSHGTPPTAFFRTGSVATSGGGSARQGRHSIAKAVSEVVSGSIAVPKSEVRLHDASDFKKGIFSDFGRHESRVGAGQPSHGAPEAVKFDTPPIFLPRLSNKGKIDYIIDVCKDMPADGYVSQCIGCLLRWILTPLLLIASVYIWVIKKLYAIYLLLPRNVIEMIFGLALCFFGGVYFAGIAAVEAAINLGGSDLLRHLSIVYEEGSKVTEASRWDDRLDSDNDGSADVENLSYGELARRKVKVAMVAVRDPDRLKEAIIAMVNVYLAVIATLKFEFAKTIAVALGLANMVTLPATRLFGPPLYLVMGKDLHHWIPAIVDTAVKFLAMFFAAWLQSFISAFYSGLRGGRLFALGFLNALSEVGCMDALPDCLTSKPFNPDASYVDEAIAYPLAAAGFYIQVRNGFTLPFPYDLALLPLTIVEWILRFQVYS